MSFLVTHGTPRGQWTRLLVKIFTCRVIAVRKHTFSGFDLTAKGSPGVSLEIREFLIFRCRVLSWMFIDSTSVHVKFPQSVSTTVNLFSFPFPTNKRINENFQVVNEPMVLGRWFRKRFYNGLR